MNKKNPTTVSRVPRATNNRGFVLLLSIVIAAILFSVSVGIASFAYKEVILASTSRNSIYAFYAADTGVECAMYWDNRREDKRVTSVFESGTHSHTLECNNYLQTVDTTNLTPEFVFSLGDHPVDQNDPAAAPTERARVDVTVQKGVLREDGKLYSAIIKGWGINDNIPGNPRRVDRALDARFVSGDTL